MMLICTGTGTWDWRCTGDIPQCGTQDSSHADQVGQVPEQMEPVVELISPVYWEIEVCGDSPYWTWGGHHSCLGVWVEVGVLWGTAFWSGCSASCKFYTLIFCWNGLPCDKCYFIFCPAISARLVYVFTLCVYSLFVYLLSFDIFILRIVFSSGYLYLHFVCSEINTIQCITHVLTPVSFVVRYL